MNFQRQGRTIKSLLFSAGEVYEVDYVADFDTTEQGEQGEKGCTRIYIMEKGRFEKWSLERAKQPKTYQIFEPFCSFFPDI